VKHEVSNQFGRIFELQLVQVAPEVLEAQAP
jgi:hypothetical protein